VEETPTDMTARRRSEVDVEVPEKEARLRELRRKNVLLLRVNIGIGLFGVAITAFALVFLVATPWPLRAFGVATLTYTTYRVTLMRQEQKGSPATSRQDPVLDRMNAAASTYKDLVDATAKLFIPVVVAVLGIVYLTLK
jgi:hypothetical protein